MDEITKLENEVSVVSVSDLMKEEKNELLNIQKKKVGCYSTTGEELLNMKIETLPYLVKDLLPKTGTAALAGSSDGGKSSFLRGLSCSIVYGERDFLGFEINAKHKSVIYISTEDDSFAMAYLLNKQKQKDKKPADLKGLRFIFDSDNILSKLDKELESQPADLVIVDAFTDIFNGELNASNKVRSFINDFSNLSKKHSCLIIFLHHTGKRTELFPPSKDNLLGSQGFEAKMRLVLELRKDYVDMAKRHLCIVKGNYMPDYEKDKSIVLEFDENLNFKRLAERVALYLLAKPEDKKDLKVTARVRAIQLRKQGLSISKITTQLKKEELKASRSTVGEWVKNCPSIQNTQVEVEDGQSNEDVSDIEAAS